MTPTIRNVSSKNGIGIHKKINSIQLAVSSFHKAERIIVHSYHIFPVSVVYSIKRPDFLCPLAGILYGIGNLYVERFIRIRGNEIYLLILVLADVNVVTTSDQLVVNDVLKCMGRLYLTIIASNLSGAKALSLSCRMRVRT